MQPHRHGLREIRIADDHRNRPPADRITEDNKARGETTLKRDLRLAGNLERMLFVAAEAHHSVSCHYNQRRLDEHISGRGDLGN
jgi:hypothetical protein